MYKDNPEQGFTLIEWLIGLGIGLLLLTFVCQLYLDAYKLNYSIIGSHQMRSQERIALNFLVHDIRMAGFIGCPNLREVNLPPSSYRLPHSAVGSPGKRGDSHFPELPSKACKESDVLYLQYADPDRKPVIQAHKNTIQFPKNPNFSPNTVLLISDCKHAEVFQLKNMQLKYRYADDARVSRFYRFVYYVARTARTNIAHQPIYSLYRQDLNTKEQPAELVEGIASLEVQYGIANHLTRLHYVPADQVTNWQAVRSVKVTLSSSSTEQRVYKQQSIQASPSLKRNAQQTVMIRAQANHYLI